MTVKNDIKLETRIAQACHFIDQATGGLSVPIQPSTTYARDTN